MKVTKIKQEENFFQIKSKTIKNKIIYLYFKEHQALEKEGHNQNNF